MRAVKRPLALLLVLRLLCWGLLASAQPPVASAKQELSDAALLKSLPGFTDGYATVNGVRLHYVAGGKGPLLVLLPGWPQTWWSYHKIMPALATKYRVIVVEIRGMGGSDKPAAGYDKKTMARDIYGLVQQLGHRKVRIAGHDIGAHVAFSFAANHPEATEKLVMLDVPHPNEDFETLTMLPTPGTFGNKLNEQHPYVWWFAFNQVKGLPEQLLVGRFEVVQNWFFHYQLNDDAAVSARDRAIYLAAYDNAEAIRASNGWYQAFNQDIADYKGYAKLTMPILGIGGSGFKALQSSLPKKATNLKLVKAEGSGHFVAEEKPQQVTDFMLEFLN